MTIALSESLQKTPKEQNPELNASLTRAKQCAQCNLRLCSQGGMSRPAMGTSRPHTTMQEDSLTTTDYTLGLQISMLL